MATIIDTCLWTVTEDVANHMVDTGLLQLCQHEHILVMAVDKPIYHISPDAPGWFGFSTMHGAILGAERAVDLEKKLAEADAGSG